MKYMCLWSTIELPLQHDMTLTEFHKSREILLSKEKEYKDINDEEEINDIRLKGLIQEQKSLDR